MCGVSARRAPELRTLRYGRGVRLGTTIALAILLLLIVGAAFVQFVFMVD